MPTCIQFTLSDVADLSQVVIAVANLGLAFYIFIYQKNKDKNAELQTALLHEQNIKLQWFKELVLQPNLNGINRFYDQLFTVPSRFSSNDMDYEERLVINNFIKQELAILRKSFVDLLIQVDKKLAEEILANLDGLIDDLTETIFNEELKLKNSIVCEKHINSKISYSKNSLMGLLYNYKGVS